MEYYYYYYVKFSHLDRNKINAVPISASTVKCFFLLIIGLKFPFHQVGPS